MIGWLDGDSLLSNKVSLLLLRLLVVFGRMLENLVNETKGLGFHWTHELVSFHHRVYSYVKEEIRVELEYI